MLDSEEYIVVLRVTINTPHPLHPARKAWNILLSIVILTLIHNEVKWSVGILFKKAVSSLHV